jgi:hypothetical protein
MGQTTAAAGAIAVGREAIAHDDAAKGITQQNNGGGGGAAKALHEHRHEHRHQGGHQPLRGSQPISF